MPKRFKIFLGLYFLFALACLVRIMQINHGLPSRVMEKEAILPYSVTTADSKTTVIDYSFGKREINEQTYHTCTIHVRVEMGERLPEQTQSLFPFAIVANYELSPDIQEVSASLRDPETHKIKWQPGETVDGTISYVLACVDDGELIAPSLVMKPYAYTDVYDQKWDEGAIYLEYIPLEVSHVAS